MSNANTSQKSKSRRLHLRSEPRTRLRQIGVSPSETMPAGIYKAICEAARIITKWGKSKIECSFRVIEGDHFGTALPGWIEVKLINNGVMPNCEYSKVCSRILGREIEPGDDVDPESILVGKVVRIEARFRLTDGKSQALQDGTQKKGPEDFLRVRSILGTEDL